MTGSYHSIPILTCYIYISCNDQLNEMDKKQLQATMVGECTVLVLEQSRSICSIVPECVNETHGVNGLMYLDLYLDVCI